MDNIYIRKIVVDAAGGRTVHDAIADAFTLSHEHDCDIEVIHNDSHFMVEKSAVNSFMTAVIENRARKE